MEAYKVPVKRVARAIPVEQDERLLALALRPPILEQGYVPVDFVEDVRQVNVSTWAVMFLPCRTNMRGPRHVVLVVVQSDDRIVAGREMNIRTKWGGVAVAVHVWESGAGVFVVRVLHAHAMRAVRVGRVGRDVVVGARARELHRLDGTTSGV